MKTVWLKTQIIIISMVLIYAPGYATTLTPPSSPLEFNTSWTAPIFIPQYHVLSHPQTKPQQIHKHDRLKISNTWLPPIFSHEEKHLAYPPSSSSIKPVKQQYLHTSLIPSLSMSPPKPSAKPISHQTSLIQSLWPQTNTQNTGYASSNIPSLLPYLMPEQFTDRPATQKELFQPSLIHSLASRLAIKSEKKPTIHPPKNITSAAINTPTPISKLQNRTEQENSEHNHQDISKLSPEVQAILKSNKQKKKKKKERDTTRDMFELTKTPTPIKAECSKFNYYWSHKPIIKSFNCTTKKKGQIQQLNICYDKNNISPISLHYPETIPKPNHTTPTLRYIYGKIKPKLSESQSLWSYGTHFGDKISYAQVEIRWDQNWISEDNPGQLLKPSEPWLMEPGACYYLKISVMLHPDYTKSAKPPKCSYWVQRAEWATIEDKELAQLLYFGIGPKCKAAPQGLEL